MEGKKHFMPKVTSTLRAKSTSPQMTRKFGEVLGKKLWPKAVVALIGDLGSGKTVLAQGILEGLGVKDRYMVSPSYVLIKEYKGRLPAYHLDLFRLKKGEELNQLGIKEYLFGNGVTIIEWAEKAREILVQDAMGYLEIHLGFISARTRDITFFPKGRRYQKLLNIVNFNMVKDL